MRAGGARGIFERPVHWRELVEPVETPVGAEEEVAVAGPSEGEEVVVDPVEGVDVVGARESSPCNLHLLLPGPRL
jgi:hypothetical protein